MAPLACAPKSDSMEDDTEATLGEEIRGSKRRDRAETSLARGVAALGNFMSPEGHQSRPEAQCGALGRQRMVLAQDRQP